MKFIRTALLTSLVATLASASPVGAANDNPTWQAAQTVRLPAGATELSQGYLPTLSCPSAGNCVAAGAVADASSNLQGLVLTENAGVWGAPQQLTPPVDAGPNPYMTIYSLSCVTIASCAAVGSYQDSNGNVQSFVANETTGTWSTALKVTLPANALGSGQVSNVKTVSCASAGNCSAAGSYFDNNTSYPRTVVFTVVESAGNWSRAQALAMPGDANFNPFASASQITCHGAKNCDAVGSYIDTNGTARGLLISQVNGRWTTHALTLPGNANAYPQSSLSEVTCVSSGNCVAIGTYADTNGYLQGLIATEARGVWGRAQTMVMPTNAAASPHVFFYGYNGVSCSSVGNCAAGGQYRDRSNNYQGFLINETTGAWQPATQLVLPSGAQSGGRNGGVVAVSCLSSSACSAGAAYLDGAGNYQALVVNEVGGSWLAGKKVTLPAGATTVGVAGGVYGLICHPSGPCTATGSYLDPTGTYQGFTVSST